MSQPQLGVQGLLIGIGSGSPPSYTTVLNVEDFAFPNATKTVDTTSVADTWERIYPTLLQLGKVTFKVFWVTTEATHKNTSGGLRYLWKNKVLVPFQFTYPDSGSPVDQIQAYITEFKIDGKVADVFHASITLGPNDQAPVLA